MQKKVVILNIIALLVGLHGGMCFYIACSAIYSDLLAKEMDSGTIAFVLLFLGIGSLFIWVAYTVLRHRSDKSIQSLCAVLAFILFGVFASLLKWVFGDLEEPFSLFGVLYMFLPLIVAFYCYHVLVKKLGSIANQNAD